MLKQIKLELRKKSLAKTLAEAVTVRTKYKAEIEKLERAAEELDENSESYSDDLKALEEKTNEIEKEFDGEKLEKEEKDLQSQIDDVEKELDEIRKNSAVAKIPEKRKEGKKMAIGEIRTGFFKGMNIETRNAVLENEDMKGFLTKLRSMKGQTRAVSGADLGIPEVALGLIKDNLDRYSKLYSKVTVKTISGDGRQMITGTVPEAIWTEAAGKINELSFGFNEVRVGNYKVAGFIPVANYLLEDVSDFSLASEIMDAISQSIGLALDKAIVYGTGSNMPLGIVPRLAQSSQPTGYAANAPTWENLATSNVLKISIDSSKGAEFFASLAEKLAVCKENYSTGKKIWIMNETTRLKLVTKAATFDNAGALVSSITNQMPLIGGEIITLPFIPNNEIIGGYGSLYLLADRKKITVNSSSEVRFLDDQTVFKGVARYDGMPVFGEAFVAINFANTAVTTSVTFAADAANAADET